MLQEGLLIQVPRSCGSLLSNDILGILCLSAYAVRAVKSGRFGRTGHETLQQRPAPGIDSAFNRNEYQEYRSGGKGGRCVGLTTVTLHVSIV